MHMKIRITPEDVGPVPTGRPRTEAGGNRPYMLAALLVLVSLVTARVASAQEQQGTVAAISPDVTRYLKTYCVRCHGPQEQNADVRLDTMPVSIPDGTVALKWQDVLDVLNLGQMPPTGEARPPKEAETRAIEALTANLLEARKRLTDTGGHVVIRRLNRRQYARTIDALFGVPVDVSMLPEDATVDGFDTLGQAQSFSSLHLERYLEIGRRVLDQTYNFKSHRPFKHVEQSESRIAKKIHEEIPRLEKKVENYAKSIADGRKDHVQRREITKLEIELSRDYLDRSETQNGALIPFRGLVPNAWTSFNKSTRPGTYRVRVRCGIATDKPIDSFYMKVVRGEYRSKVPDAIDYYHITGTVAEPQTVEFTIDIDGIRSNRLEFSRRDIRPRRLARYDGIRDYIFKYPLVAHLADDKRPDLWIDAIELDGPLPRTEPTLSAKSLFDGKEPEGLDERSARQLIERFAFEAFRHETPDSGYIDRLMAIYATSLRRGASPIDALKDAFAVVLATPRFLYLEEPQPESGKARALTDRELAMRLSYFLWSAPPDAELYRLAEERKLHEPDVLTEQINRLLNSSRSNIFTETFASQWLELDRLKSIDPNGTSSPTYDDAVHRHSRREVVETIRFLLKEDRPVSDLLDSRYVVINSLLADFYGLRGVAGDDFRRVDLPADSPRGGLPGQSAVLTLTGTGVRTSPVERGAWVLRKLLHRPPPPAPANVPMLDEDSIGQKSIRDTLTMHQSAPQCASCHRRIDPLGFGLENFDAVGLWRTSVKVVTPPDESEDNGQIAEARYRTFPIDAKGVMPDGVRQFDGPSTLKQRLSEDREAFLHGLTEALMTYALGRTIAFADKPRVDQIVAATIEDDYRLRTLIHEIVRSDAFMMRSP